MLLGFAATASRNSRTASVAVPFMDRDNAIDVVCRRLEPGFNSIAICALLAASASFCLAFTKSLFPWASASCITSTTARLLCPRRRRDGSATPPATDRDGLLQPPLEEQLRQQGVRAGIIGINANGRGEVHDGVAGPAQLHLVLAWLYEAAM